jgi:hypothetical protein
LTGIYIGQEYQLVIPNIRVLSLSIIAFIQEKYKEEHNRIQDENNKGKESFFNWFN